MCLMCVEFARERMNFLEVRRALGEMVNTATTTAERRHYEEMAKMSEEELQKAAAEYTEEQEA